LKDHTKNITDNGFTIIEDVFSNAEVNAIERLINNADATKPTFRQTADLFAIRQFLKEVPVVIPHVFTATLNSIINGLFGDDYFVVKSIYFDKPAASNWFVAYHQDITISVAAKHELSGFINWTNKQGQFAVQPPVQILENNFTIRIHLDDTDENNGALKVIPGTHAKGVYRAETISAAGENEQLCRVKKGGIMIMRPLLMHASGRTVNDKKRRVIHIEFSNTQLPVPLQWGELVNQPVENN
jgi:ectoine hydroxylase-related dioxygenase (phytanoyl-CoA dioxygenase family)